MGLYAFWCESTGFKIVLTMYTQGVASLQEDIPHIPSPNPHLFAFNIPGWSR